VDQFMVSVLGKSGSVYDERKHQSSPPASQGGLIDSFMGPLICVPVRVGGCLQWRGFCSQYLLPPSGRLPEIERFPGVNIRSPIYTRFLFTMTRNDCQTDDA